jgi:hypothetical protein
MRKQQWQIPSQASDEHRAFAAVAALKVSCVQQTSQQRCSSVADTYTRIYKLLFEEQDELCILITLVEKSLPHLLWLGLR